MLVALWRPCGKFWSSPKWRPGWCNFGPCHCNHYQSMSLLMIMILLTWQNNDKLCSNKRYWLPGVISRKRSIREPDYKLILQFSCFHVIIKCLVMWIFGYHWSKHFYIHTTNRYCPKNQPSLWTPSWCQGSLVMINIIIWILKRSKEKANTVILIPSDRTCM